MIGSILLIMSCLFVCLLLTFESSEIETSYLQLATLTVTFILKIALLFATWNIMFYKHILFKNFRQKLFVQLAKEQGYSKVMVGDCSTRLAVRLLSDMAQGHGAHVSMDTVSQMFSRMIN